LNSNTNHKPKEQQATTKLNLSWLYAVHGLVTQQQWISHMVRIKVCLCMYCSV